MKTIEQTRRELFEAWFKRDVWKDGCFGNPDILKRQLWPCWNAALDAVVIELPDYCTDASRYATYEGGWNDMRGEAVDAIESTNLGLKII